VAEETATGGGAVISGYFNQRATVWDETSSETDMTKLELMSKRLNIKPGSTVLEVGSGTGVFIPFLLRRVGRKGRLVALDFAEEMLRRARAKGFKDVAYLHADVTSIPIGDEIFDVVVCYSSFPHFQDKPRALAEINRVTKSGGRLLICHTSSRAMVNQLHRQIPAVANDTIPDEPEMQFMLSRAGFTDIRIDDGKEGYLARTRKPRLA
jgi:ubiquinone/menaquinone biosynthesis C-methylase UbiE